MARLIITIEPIPDDLAGHARAITGISGLLEGSRERILEIVPNAQINLASVRVKARAVAPAANGEAKAQEEATNVQREGLGTRVPPLPQSRPRRHPEGDADV